MLVCSYIQNILTNLHLCIVEISCLNIFLCMMCLLSSQEMLMFFAVYIVCFAPLSLICLELEDAMQRLILRFVFVILS